MAENAHDTSINLLWSLTVTLSSLCFAVAAPCQAAAEHDGAAAKAATSGVTKSADKGSVFFTRAVQFYQRNDFQSAELNLRQAISAAPADPSAHYYLANTLVHLNRHDEAIEEFKRAYHLDPFGPTSGYCRKALKTYESHPNIFSQTNKEDASEPIEATSSIMRYQQKDPKDTRDPKDPKDPKDGAGANPQEKLVSLRSQAEREKARHQQVADSFSRAMHSTAAGEAQAIRQNAREDIDQILHGTRGGLPWVQQAAEARAAEVQHNADEMEKISRERAQERAAEYKSVSKAKGKALDETVSNLERQLVTKTLPGTPTLRHDGTDLFVRSYAPSTKKSPYPEAHPAVARVNPARIVPVTVDDDTEDAVSAKAKPMPKHDVKGKVLD